MHCIQLDKRHLNKFQTMCHSLLQPIELCEKAEMYRFFFLHILISARKKKDLLRHRHDDLVSDMS